MQEHTELILDGTKINWHMDRIQAWERERKLLQLPLIWL